VQTSDLKWPRWDIPPLLDKSKYCIIVGLTQYAYIYVYIYTYTYLYIYTQLCELCVYIYDTVSRRLSPVSYIHSSFYFNDVLAISRLLLLFEPIQKCTVVSTALHGWQPPGVQTFEGPFRLSQALRLVFGLAVSVREDWRMTQGFATR
jgi:hypothetical protein